MLPKIDLTMCLVHLACKLCYAGGAPLEIQEPRSNMGALRPIACSLHHLHPHRPNRLSGEGQLLAVEHDTFLKMLAIQTSRNLRIDVGVARRVFIV